MDEAIVKTELVLLYHPLFIPPHFPSSRISVVLLRRRYRANRRFLVEILSQRGEIRVLNPIKLTLVRGRGRGGGRAGLVVTLISSFVPRPAWKRRKAAVTCPARLRFTDVSRSLAFLQRNVIETTILSLVSAVGGEGENGFFQWNEFFQSRSL